MSNNTQSKIYKFDADKILRPCTNVHCKTEEQAIALCAWADNLGRTWMSGDTYLSKNNWARYKENSVYDIELGQFGDITRNSEIVLAFEEVLLPHVEIENDLKPKDNCLLKLKEGQRFDESDLIISSIEIKGSVAELFYIDIKTIRTIMVDTICKYCVIINNEIEIRFGRSNFEKIDLNQIENWIDRYLN